MPEHDQHIKLETEGWRVEIFVSRVPILGEQMSIAVSRVFDNEVISERAYEGENVREMLFDFHYEQEDDDDLHRR